MKRNYLLSAFSLGYLTLLASAQVNMSPGVARISTIYGDVSTQRGDTGDWAAAALNQPLVAGDRISTGDNSQAELQLDHANILRLGNNAQAKIATVERAQIQVQVGQGLVYYTVFNDSDAEVELATPNAAIRPTSKGGVYRIEVSGYSTQVIVRSGAAEIFTPQGETRVEKGQAATVRGTTDEAGCVLGGAPSEDNWDSWNTDRDGVIRGAQSWHHTSRYYVGSEDLDAYGHWVNVPDYGQVWSPTVAAGWAPYRAGRWVSEPYWGWTWVSSEPWGWAPYHYGRWFLYGSSWMWWPGRVDGSGDDRPEWAPAYVTFFGFGGHRKAPIGFGFGRVGWLPSGPGDRFYPWYGRSVLHFNVVSITNATDIVNANRGSDGIAPLLSSNRSSNLLLAAHDLRVRKALSTLTVDHFATGRSAPTAVGRGAFRDGYMIAGNLPIVPTKGTLSASNRPASPASMRGRPQERFFTKKQVAATPPSLDKQAAQVQASTQGDGRVIPVREVTQLDSATTPRPLPQESAIERAVQPVRNAQDASRARPRLGRGSRTKPPSRIPPPKSTPARRMTTLAAGSRGATPRFASKPDVASRTPFSRTPSSKATSTRRITKPAPPTQQAMARAAQSYLGSANRQFDKGNYTAAIANYKQALQVDGKSTTAKTRLGRARRAMQAENEIIANRR